ncbi:MAG TPA: GNAT family N-acetyltransferase [Dokdonella sp.]
MERERASAPAEPGVPAVPAAGDFRGAEFLRTRRLVLRELRLADVGALIALNAQPEVSRWLVEPCPTDYFGVAKIVVRANENYLLRPGLGVWHASDAHGCFVGVFSLVPIDGGDEVEIGTRLLPAAWGRLYPVEGGRALCAHAFERIGLSHLVGLCHPHNRAVPAILRRLGFRADGETRHFGNVALRYVLRREDWRTRVRRAQASAVAQPHEGAVS